MEYWYRRASVGFQIYRITGIPPKMCNFSSVRLCMTRDLFHLVSIRDVCIRAIENQTWGCRTKRRQRWNHETYNMMMQSNHWGFMTTCIMSGECCEYCNYTALTAMDDAFIELLASPPQTIDNNDECVVSFSLHGTRRRDNNDFSRQKIHAFHSGWISFKVLADIPKKLLPPPRCAWNISANGRKEWVSTRASKTNYYYWWCWCNNLGSNVVSKINRTNAIFWE